jgi:hypothetical protein
MTAIYRGMDRAALDVAYDAITAMQSQIVRPIARADGKPAL